MRATCHVSIGSSEMVMASTGMQRARQKVYTGRRIACLYPGIMSHRHGVGDSLGREPLCQVIDDQAAECDVVCSS